MAESEIEELNIVIDGTSNKTYSMLLESLSVKESRGTVSYCNENYGVGKYAIKAGNMEPTGYFEYDGKGKWTGTWNELTDINSIEDFMGVRELDWKKVKKTDEAGNSRIDYTYLNSISDAKKQSKASKAQDDAVKAYHQYCWNKLLYIMATPEDYQKIKYMYIGNDEEGAKGLLRKILRIGESFEYKGEKHKITQSGIIAACHVMLIERIKDYLEKNERIKKVERICNQIEEYMSEFAGYNLGELFVYSPQKDMGIDVPQEEAGEEKGSGTITIKNYSMGHFDLLVPDYINKNHAISLDAKDEVVIPEIDFGSFSGKAVCNGAMLKCSKGAAPSNLKVLPIKQVYLNEQAIATISDMKPMVNILPFGACMRPHNPPCTPMITAPWKDPIKHFISTEEVVCTNSTLTCSFGGKISVAMEGQTGVGYQSSSSSNEEKTEEKSEEKSEECTKAVVTKFRIDKAVEDSNAGKEININLAEEYRKKIVTEAKYWEGKIPYCRNDIVKTQILAKDNPPPYMDCSDFTSSVYLTLMGINIGGNCSAQLKRGKKVEESELKEGDLIIFDWKRGRNEEQNGTPDHVGIYIGNGEFIHETGRNTDANNLEEGQNVKIEKLDKNWGKPYGIIKSNIMEIRRIIQDDGTYLNTEKETGKLSDLGT